MAELTLAIERYDRLIPFYDGTVVPPDGYRLRVLQVGETTVLRNGKDRNERMLMEGEFDVCEFGLSAYLMARDRGMDISAIPVFPRRLFSQSQIFVNADSPITHPAELAGRRVALNSFQTSLSVLALGDLKSVYGARWEDIVWCPTADEMVGVPDGPRPRIDRRCFGRRQDLGEMLEAGEIDAFLLPRPPRAVAAGRVRARRLFADPRAEELAYFRTQGFFPVMHLVAIRHGLAELAPAVMAMFAAAERIARDYYADPNWSRLVWSRHYAEAETAALGADPWPIGLAANRANLERFAGYALDQGLIRRAPDIDALFAPSVRDT